ncbi:MAG: urease accessory protein [Alphaproteobacteria bacterium]|nr:urease accessory protein [Alphaproteobacteria bacterium]
MTLLSILAVGFLLGLRHALDADHIAAVAALATRSRSIRETVKTGIAWGIGHTVTLFTVCAAIILSGVAFPERIAGALEFLVGLILVGLGVDVIQRIVRERIHVHAHEHRNNGSHIHFHSHKEGAEHNTTAHEHEHRSNLPSRALTVGLMHGLAGSAALLLLAVSQQVSTIEALSYVLVFGVGSVFGMGILSAAIAWPIMASARKGNQSFKRFNLAIGTGTAAIGAFVMIHSYPSIAALLTTL